MNSASNAPIAPVRITKDFALAKCNYFVDVQLWPILSQLDPKGWLSNFTSREMDHAVHLLYSFVFYSEKLIDELFVAAFQGLSRERSMQGRVSQNVKTEWRNFINRAIITYVTGEVPNVTDSGYTFARKSRQLLGIPEEHIMSPDEAVKILYNNKRPPPVVFVDDFVGSGDQFVTTWERTVKLSKSVRTSFKKIAGAVRGSRFFYCPLLCTEFGYERLMLQCSPTRIAPAHVVSSRFSAFHPKSIIWPTDLRPTAKRFVENASKRAGITGISWKGYNDFGLAMAFHHSVPDATLPIIYWEQNGWKPLIRRS